MGRCHLLCEVCVYMIVVSFLRAETPITARLEQLSKAGTPIVPLTLLDYRIAYIIRGGSAPSV